jgi:purine nucleoside phosphorylase
VTTPVALIGGTGFEAPPGPGAEPCPVDTPYGSVTLHRVSLGGAAAWFWSRHGERHHLPPHRVPYRAGLWALASQGVRRVLATQAVGSLDPRSLPPGSLAAVADLMDFTHGRTATFFDGPPLPVVHVDSTHLYCPEIRAALNDARRAQGEEPLVSAVLAVTQGPRLETPAEIRALRRLGAHVVGMTGAPEAPLARELGLCYAAVAVVVNWAAGLAPAVREADMQPWVEVARPALWRLVEDFARFGHAHPGPCSVCPPSPYGALPRLDGGETTC